MKVLIIALSVLGAAVVVLFFLLRPSAGNDILVLATTTSTENSGLLSHIHPDFEKKTGIRIKVIAKGTGASLRLARDGNADVVLVHAKGQEDAFIASGCGVDRRPVCYNDFIIIGSDEDKAQIRGMSDAAAAFEKIAESKQTFVSRGDDSGTHYKEQYLWKESGLALETVEKEIIKKGKTVTVSMTAPPGPWYHAIGRGMGAAVTYATEKKAYLLCDRGTYYAMASRSGTDLAILCEGDTRLYNPYSVMAVNPEKHAHVNFSAAKKYVAWITSPDVQELIGAFRLDGKVLFHPAAKPK